jgi:hypothetical protein
MTHGEEPGKQKTRRRRAQELSRSCARENAWWKWKVDRIVQLAFGGDWSRMLRLTGLARREGAADKEWESEQTRSAPGSRLLGGEPSTRRPVVESVGERGTAGKSEAGACVEGGGGFRERGAGQRSRP